MKNKPISVICLSFFCILLIVVSLQAKNSYKNQGIETPIGTTSNDVMTGHEFYGGNEAKTSNSENEDIGVDGYICEPTSETTAIYDVHEFYNREIHDIK